VTCVLWNLVSVSLEKVLASVFCTKRTIRLEIVLDASDGTPRLRGSSGSSFWSIWKIVLILMQDRCMVCTERTIGSEIVLDAPDGNPR
jgi:hypothetical protein